MGPSEDARFRKALLELYESANRSDVAGRILQAVKLLIPGDVLAVTEVNYRTGQVGGYSLPAPEDCLHDFKTVAESYQTLERHFHEHPIVMGFRDTRSVRAERISDHLSAPRFHDMAIYREFYRKMRVEDQVVLMLPTGPDSAAGIAVSRARRSFRAVHVDRLNRLGPHVMQAYRNAERITAAESWASRPADRVAAALEALGLARRESEVLQVIASGCSNAQAAAALGVSPLTIKKHLEHIYEKLGVGTRAAAVARLLRQLGVESLREVRSENVQQRIGHYELIAPIGEGGMGVVYRALDTQLGRHVAIKVVSERLTRDPEARARFEREARIAAALNHPNICTIHGILNIEGVDVAGGDAAGATRAIVFELVEGQTLAARIAERGPLPARMLLQIAVQIADGLAAAHRQHIVHRDLKPQNIIITPDERVKILDFGLARPSAAAPFDDQASTVAALDVSRLSAAGGAVRGTVPSLSPEQIAGKPLDGRSDLFAFGIVLFEMAVGRRPFAGDTTLEVIAQILQSETPSLAARADLPAGVERIMRRCLEKRPDDRYQDARDLAAELRAVDEGSRMAYVGPTFRSGVGTEATVRSDARAEARAYVPAGARWLVAAGVAGAIGIGAAVLWPGWRTRPAVPAAHRQVTFVSDASFPTISPDGNFVAYVRGEPWGESTLTAGLRSAQRVIVQDLTGGGRELEVAQCRPCTSLAWSPDGRSILVARQDGLSLVPRLGGSARPFSGGGHVAWNRDGSAFVSTALGGKRVGIVRLDTSDSKEIALTWTFTWINGLDWSPVRDELVVLTEDANRVHSAWIVSLDGSRQERIFEETRATNSVRWAPDGRTLYYVRGGEVTELMAQRLTAAGGADSSPVALTSGISLGPNVTIARDGRTLLYTRELRSANLWAAGLGAGEGETPRQLTAGSFVDQFPSVSPDGARVAFVRKAGRTSNVFTMSVAGGSPEQLSFLATTNGAPAWAPDGQRLAFCAAAQGGHTAWILDLRKNQPRAFDDARCPSAGAETPITWAPWREILYQAPGNRNYHWLDPVSGASRPLLADESSGWLFAPMVTPDGSTVAAYWNRKDSAGGRGAWVLSASGDAQRRILPGFVWPLGWSADSRTLLAFAPDTMTVLSVPHAGGTPRELRNLSAQRVGLAPALTADRRTVIYSVHAINADVWAMENFDPQAAR